MTQCSRRQVIKTLVLGTAFSNVIGRSWSAPLLVALQAPATNQDGFLRVNLADFPELTQARGSVRISTSSLNPTTNKQVGLFPPLIINRGNADDFYVMSAACTHEECIVRRLSKTSSRMVCPCHGSEYFADGSVANGPAQQPLLPYSFARSGDFLTIEMPEVFYEMTVEKTASASRVQISFIAFDTIKYEIYFRESLTATPQRVSFATSPTGPINQTEIGVADDYAHVFVERPGHLGFFEVAMKTRTV